MNCAVSEKCHTHPMEGHWKFLGGGGLEAKMSEPKYEVKLGGCKKLSVGGGSMDISWNCTFWKFYSNDTIMKVNLAITSSFL